MMPPPLKSLTEHALRTIIANVDSIDSLGILSYRLAKPILALMSAEQLVEVEKNSPHLKEDDQEIWQDLCIKRFGIKLESPDFEPPKSWRKFYRTEIVRLQQLENDAGARARNRYQAATAQKQERSLVFDPYARPVKLGKAWGRPAPPKTLADKARSTARRQQSSMFIPSARNASVSSSAAGSSLLFNTAPTRAIKVTTTTVKAPRAVLVPPAGRARSTASGSHSSASEMSPPPPPPPRVAGVKRRLEEAEMSPPPLPPASTYLPTPATSPTPSSISASHSSPTFTSQTPLPSQSPIQPAPFSPRNTNTLSLDNDDDEDPLFARPPAPAPIKMAPRKKPRGIDCIFMPKHATTPKRLSHWKGPTAAQ